MPRKILSDEQEAEVISRYLDRETPKNMALEYGVNICTIYNVLKRNNIDRHRGAFSIDHAFFDELREDSLYWAGFIAADGSINRQKGNTADRVVIGLSVKDIDHLVKFRSYVKAEQYKIQEYNSTNYGNHPACRIAVRSQRIVDRLEDLNVKGPNISKDLTDSRHFWRGAIDGDGYVTKSSNRYSIGLTGQHYILEPYREFLYTHLGIHANIMGNGKNSYKIATSGNPGARVMRYIYGDSDVYLDRKKKRAYEILAWNEAHPPGKYERKPRNGDPYR